MTRYLSLTGRLACVFVGVVWLLSGEGPLHYWEEIVNDDGGAWVKGGEPRDNVQMNI